MARGVLFLDEKFSSKDESKLPTIFQVGLLLWITWNPWQKVHTPTKNHIDLTTSAQLNSERKLDHSEYDTFKEFYENDCRNSSSTTSMTFVCGQTDMTR